MMEAPLMYLRRGGEGSHWDGCEASHWDCRIVHLERRNAALEAELEAARPLIAYVRLIAPNGRLRNEYLAEYDRVTGKEVE